MTLNLTTKLRFSISKPQESHNIQKTPHAYRMPKSATSTEKTDLGQVNKLYLEAHLKKKLTSRRDSSTRRSFNPNTIHSDKKSRKTWTSLQKLYPPTNPSSKRHQHKHNGHESQPTGKTHLRSYNKVTSTGRPTALALKAHRKRFLH